MPSFEANVGIYPNVQFFGVFPVTLVAPEHQSYHYGYRDIRVGLKYRFLHDKESDFSLAFTPKLRSLLKITNRVWEMENA